MFDYVNSTMLFGGALILIIGVAFIIGVAWLIKKMFD